MGGLTRVETTNPQGQVTGVTYSEPVVPVITEAERQAALAKQQADRDAENARIAAENLAREQELEATRVKRNATLDSAWGRGFTAHNDTWTVKPGTGYHFVENWKGDDGNYYTTFASNRGSNYKYYSISERKWYSEYAVSSYRCDDRGCSGKMRGLARFDKTCPICGKVKVAGAY